MDLIKIKRPQEEGEKPGYKVGENVCKLHTPQKDSGENRSWGITLQYFHSRKGLELGFLLWLCPLCDLEQSLKHFQHQLLNPKMNIRSALSLLQTVREETEDSKIAATVLS